MCWFFDVLGVCLGNTLWLVGLIALGIAIWAFKVKKESITKMVNMMSMMTGGKPQGFALKLKGLVDPEDRRGSFARKTLVIALVLLVVGGSFVARCAG